MIWVDIERKLHMSGREIIFRDNPLHLERIKLAGIGYVRASTQFDGHISGRYREVIGPA